ncbi:hypothetical protein G7K71_13805 [Desulfofundulus sp. TPOSR]|uniref:hypothetical protein n=1 Tax=Desulfofundulus sp. TPOSR TaxID=2714340 RepID=UPI001407B00D|nr:hypothetical protein [Desulfofundulus sp. TPOSR]NHM28032.1 hypothetical protein [Desulfofundulus sp. TPOSR]
MQPVFFPADVRQDVSVFGVRVGLLWIPVLGLFAGFLLFAYLPPGFPVLPRFLILVVPPLALFFFLAARVDVFWKKFRAYRKEPSLRLPDARGGPGSFQSLVSASAAEETFILEFDDGSRGAVLSVVPAPWEVMTEGDQTSAVAAFGAALSRVGVADAEVTVYLDTDADLPRAEWERKEARWRSAFPEGSGLRRIAEARLAHFRGLERAKPRAAVRVRWKPYDAALPRKPKDDADRKALVRRAVADLVSGFTAELERSGAKVRVLGAEAVRDLAAKQVHPLDWRRIAPVTGTDWLGGARGEEMRDRTRAGTTGSGLLSRFRRGRAGGVEVVPRMKPRVIAVAAASEAGLREAAKTALRIAERESLSLADADPRGFAASEAGLEEDTAARFDWRFNPGGGGLTLPSGVRLWPTSGRLFAVGDYSGTLREILSESGEAIVVNLGTGTLPEGVEAEQTVVVVANSTDVEVLRRLYPPGRAGRVEVVVAGGDPKLAEAVRKLGYLCH